MRMGQLSGSKTRYRNIARLFLRYFLPFFQYSTGIVHIVKVFLSP